MKPLTWAFTVRIYPKIYFRVARLRSCNTGDIGVTTLNQKSSQFRIRIDRYLFALKFAILIAVKFLILAAFKFVILVAIKFVILVVYKMCLSIYTTVSGVWGRRGGVEEWTKPMSLSRKSKVSFSVI